MPESDNKDKPIPTWQRPFHVDQLIECLQRARGAALVNGEPVFVYANDESGWQISELIPADDRYMVVFPDGITVEGDDLSGFNPSEQDIVPDWYPESTHIRGEKIITHG